MLDRREFLTTSAAAAWAQPALPDKGFARVERIAESVYATLADGRKGPQALCNGGIIAGRKGVLLVEGHFQPAGAAFEVEAARALSRAPIRGAVNTHYHFDHTFGNAAYAEQKIPIIAHQRTAELMKQRYGTWKGADEKQVLAALESRIARAADPTRRQRAEADRNAARQQFGAVQQTTLTYPTELLTANQRVDLGGITAVLELHPGHTPADLIVYVPERDVIFTGDLLFNGAYPVAIDANISAWRKALHHLLGIGKRTRFVPGHGAVCDAEPLRAEAAVLDDLTQHAAKMLQEGAPLEEAQHRYVVPERFQKFGMYTWGFTIGAAIEKLYLEKKS
jgi:glyoxylase-like metal-dependent hydrolase (beta-lactamase superfamily II)